MRNTKLLLENLKERDHLGDLDVDSKIILKWMLKEWNVTIIKFWVL